MKSAHTGTWTKSLGPSSLEEQAEKLGLWLWLLRLLLIHELLSDRNFGGLFDKIVKYFSRVRPDCMRGGEYNLNVRTSLKPSSMINNPLWIHTTYSE